ncbi:hypothetical protein SD77_1337 [Bacillus badius]|uniref:Ribose 5-phosphate isomerase B n=1 Tax=Bacillus badius TaxID=1455 RepID=A0ABR5ASN1_BACBA|nr:hypothetical protein SD78_3307 [Bacillus badius]KIL77664.1 hypothetical protein SD77_1337 [Bacillus badius]
MINLKAEAPGLNLPEKARCPPAVKKQRVNEHFSAVQTERPIALR